MWRPNPEDLVHLEEAAGILSLALALSLRAAETEEMLRSFRQFVVFANPGMARISGYSPEEFLG